jgi:hypothetical protein
VHYFDNRPNRLAEEFKATALATMAECAITQDMIADAIGVNRSTIARWFSYGGDLHFPAALTSMLSTKQLRPLALDIIRFQAQALGLNVVDGEWVDAYLDGSMDDELLEIGRLEGKMIELKDKSPRQVSRLCDEMERIVNRLRLEIKGKSK